MKLLDTISRYLLQRLETPVISYEKRIINNMIRMSRTIQPGDVLLVEGSSRMSQFIKILSQSLWSHAAFYVGDLLSGSDFWAKEEIRSSMQSLNELDRSHMLVEADSSRGVYPVPLSKYRNHNIRICRPYGIAQTDLAKVMAEVISNVGKHYDHRNIVDLLFLLLPAAINPFRERTIKACLGGCTDYQVICSGMIAKAFQNVRYPITPDLTKTGEINDTNETDPYGTKLIMRHYSQILPRDFDISPNFEVIKYNIVGLEQFNYKSLWVE
jgi:hypothetical protein